MAISQSYFHVTNEQMAACERHVDTNGNPYYTCQSASGNGEYTLRWHEGYTHPSCNCPAQPGCCWHFRTVLQLEAEYQEALTSEAISAAAREAKAVRRDGARAYTRKEFSLLK